MSNNCEGCKFDEYCGLNPDCWRREEEIGE